MSENTRAAARAVFEVWSTGAIERLDDLVARDVVQHDAYDPNAAEGLDGMKRTIELTAEPSPICDSSLKSRCPARALADNGTG